MQSENTILKFVDFKKFRSFSNFERNLDSDVSNLARGLMPSFRKILKYRKKNVRTFKIEILLEKVNFHWKGGFGPIISGQI